MTSLGLEMGTIDTFFASLKTRLKQTTIKALTKHDGTLLTNGGDIEHEVLEYYGTLP